MVIFFVDAYEDSQSLAKHNLINEKYESLLARLKRLQKIGSESSYIIVFSKADMVTSEERIQKLKDRKEKLCTMFKDKIGAESEGVYYVNSKKLKDEALSNVFSEIIKPFVTPDSPRELDWVRKEIDRN